MRFCGRCGTELAQAAGTPAERPRERTDAARDTQAERRQLTIMFCDLVGSTRLSSSLDPEDFSDLLLAYRDAAVAAVERRGGTVARVIGDGLLVYFGYPVAREDDPQHAARAALGVIAALNGLNARFSAAKRPPLTVRIGIHTGVTVVGNIGTSTFTEPLAAVGEAPNIAARLQSLAGPNEIVISDATHQLIEGQFHCADLGMRSLDGVDRAIHVHAIVRELPRPGIAGRRGSSLPFVNRQEELDILNEAWKRAQRGFGGVITIEGDPGIGKSRFVREFASRIAAPAPPPVVFACYADDSASAFHPVADWLRGDLGLASDAHAGEARQRLERMLADLGLPPQWQGPLASLLGAATEEQEADLPRSPRRRRQQLIDTIVALILAKGARSPTLVIVEDCQWIDDSTLTLVRTLTEKVPSTHLLVLLTTRSDPSAETLPGRRMVLERLTPLVARQLANTVAGGELTSGLLDRITSRTDGIPLFIEEVTRSALATGASGTATGSADLIPMTLRDSLMAQLDRLEQAKPIVQLAAVLGRNFPSEIILHSLSTRLGVQRQEAALALQDLEKRHFLEFDANLNSYSFRHALIQEAAYESLLRRRRQEYHLHIAEQLRTTFANTPDSRPEILGRHLAAAGRIDQAVTCYCEAAQQANRLSANVEALRHYQTAAKLLEALPDTPQKMDREIDVRIALASQILVAHGNAAAGIDDAIARARALCEAVGDQKRLFRALRSLQTFHMVRGSINIAHEITLELLDRVPRLNEPDLLIQAHRPHGLCLLYLGRFAEARTVLRRTLDLYDPAKHAPQRFDYGSDPGVLAHAHLAWVEWFLGNEAAAEEQSRTAVAQAQALDHPHSRCFALAFHACLDQFRGSAAGAYETAEEMIRLAQAHEYAYWGAWGEILQGWATARQGSLTAGRRLLQTGLEDYAQTGAGVLRPYALCLLAELFSPDDPAQARALLDTAISQAEEGAILFWQSQALAQKARLLHHSDPLEAEILRRRALALAKTQGLRRNPWITLPSGRRRKQPPK